MSWIHVKLVHQLVFVVLIFQLSPLTGYPLEGAQFSKSASSEVIIRELETTVDHNHSTTRQFQHMVFALNDTWFVFYSDGKNFRYQTSDRMDGNWIRCKSPIDSAPNGSSGFDLINTRNVVYLAYPVYPMGRYDPNAPYARDSEHRYEYRVEGRIKKGLIEGHEIRWIIDKKTDFIPSYTKLVIDSLKRIWIFNREIQYMRSRRSREPECIDDFLPATVPIPVKGRHALDAVALDNGKMYAASVLTDQGFLYGNLFDGEKWSNSPVLIEDKMSKVAGDDRRLAMGYDPDEKRLHLIYIDSSGILRYRRLDYPYRPEDWIPQLGTQGRTLASSVFTCALSMVFSSTPNDLIITYGIEKYVDSDPRFRTGELFTRRFDGTGWVDRELLISQPGTIFNWYPNVNLDASKGLTILYSRSLNANKVVNPLAIMVSQVKGFVE
jgi:hypothetical protein